MSDPAFFGRTGELESLQDAYESRSAEMAIIYGRRRIGKTALIQKFCEGKPVFFYTAKSWKDSYQLEQFSRAVGIFCGNPQLVFLNWAAALKAAATRPEKDRKVLVIDEFQYIAKERPSILSELQVLWDEVLSHENILLILCGSAVSFIAKEVLGEKNPLYGRARTLMKVRPLPFQTVAEFVPAYTAEDIFRGYAALGGIPYFWQAVDPRKSMTENLAVNLLRSNGFLNDEAQSVLRQEFRDPGTYNAILRSIAFGATTRGEISQKSLVDPRILTKYLSVLEDMDFVVKEFPVFSGHGDLGNTSRGIYRISDPYLKFWFRFLSTPPALIMTRQEALAEWDASVEPFFAEFASDTFEEVCRQYLNRKRLEGRLPFRPAALGRWWKGGTEIDIVGADHERRQCLAGECKYRSQKTGVKVLRTLQAKCSQLPVEEDARFDYWIFSRAGFEDALQEAAAKDPSVHLVGMAELLR
ncbi:ATP-binding protein [Mesosutterella sp. AGMB02718]|uniref:ATP-binding protein n=1 Tax=Mesosutterella faecium TaxID=2925194 RepID=A0ABT7INL8_9BURK|nr:ATP-binding protein [Mesosutterella sp. AGMB02718]MDL2059978.1 ATP-binding protein [Mesosutterella sp. AGMB02718]